MINSKLFTAALFFAFSMLTGFLTSHAGRPLNTLNFTLHKLTALAAIVFVFLYVFNQFKSQSTDFIYTLLLVFVLVGMAILIITGAFLSFEKPFPIILSRIHQIFPAFVFIVFVIFFIKQR